MKYQKLSSSFAFFFFCLLVSFSSLAINFPSLNSRVYDGANIFNENTKASIVETSESLEKKTSIQLVVASFDSLQGESIESFGYQLGRYWGIGQKKLNNGVILIFAPKEKMVRIEVGYGLEGELTDAVCSTIIHQQILPSYRENNLDQAAIKGVEAIVKILAHDADYKNFKPIKKNESKEVQGYIIIFIILLALFADYSYDKNHIALKEKASNSKNYLFKFLVYLLLIILIILSLPCKIMFKRGSGINRSSGNGGFRGGGFSGGGGSFGGGGASGRA